MIAFGKLWLLALARKFDFTKERIMAESVLREQTKEFAKNIIVLCRSLKARGIEGALTNQLLRCGTSIGANVYAAQYAQGSKDFISKFEIALKECNESDYWLSILYETNALTKEEYSFYHSQCINIRRMLVSSVNTIKEKTQSQANITNDKTPKQKE